MKTDDLIHAIVADRWPRLGFEWSVWRALGIGFALSLSMFTAILTVRPDLLVALDNPRVVLKFCVTLALAFLAAVLAVRLAQPSAPTKGPRLSLAIVPTLLLFGIIPEVLTIPPSQWGSLWRGSNAAYCLALVPLLSIPLLGAGLLGLKQGAPLHPWRAGAALGAAAGGFGGAIYALHCPDDSPLFLATWYGIAITGTAVIGALIARRALRW